MFAVVHTHPDEQSGAGVGVEGFIQVVILQQLSDRSTLVLGGDIGVGVNFPQSVHTMFVAVKCERRAGSLEII